MKVNNLMGYENEELIIDTIEKKIDARSGLKESDKPATL